MGRFKVRDKRGLLVSMMEALAGDAHISFEGKLDGLKLFALPGVSELETLALKRNTISPRLDFLVLPLEQSTVKSIISALGGNVPSSVIHIQIEKSGRLEFGAYDNFHRDCIRFGPAVSPTLISALSSNGSI